ncbi:MAG: peptide-methionine (S)-S-oxide reductase MsrA [Oscillospiraceae bacterium]|nr:peptide-methionine (S)-S-oxide reductase MsrA [Oscillospiraceae bacterium]
MAGVAVRYSCRRAAVFSDIHSNYHAFHACFEDARIQGADCFIFLGDYVSDLASPRECLDLVYEIRSRYPTVCLRGNRERYMLEHASGSTRFETGSKSGSLLFTFGQLRQEDFEFFRSLPVCTQIELNGIPFEIAHAFKENDRRYFESDDPQLEEIFAQMGCPYLLTGHSHRQYIRYAGSKTIINPGSIGVPMTSNALAQYALLDFCHGAVDCILRAVSYDLAATVHVQFESGLVAYAKYWALGVLQDVRTGKECAIRLLELVSRTGDVRNEENWHAAAVKMGLPLTEKEILMDIKKTETAYFAGGCFWCITPVFKEMEGVVNVISGYSGGAEVNPTYADVKKQKTRHRETIRIDFDPEQVSFAQLLEVFLSSVDPFDPDGQFIDRGHSYTLAVYHCSGTQQQAAKKAVRTLEAESGQAVYVSIEPFRSFYVAEEAHQDYYLKHPEAFRQELIDSGRIKA